MIFFEYNPSTHKALENRRNSEPASLHFVLVTVYAVITWLGIGRLHWDGVGPTIEREDWVKIG